MENRGDTIQTATKGSLNTLQTTPGMKHDRNSILDYIRNHTPITQYRLSKELGINKSSIYQICREFEFAGLIEFRVEIASNNKIHKLIIIPRKKQEQAQFKNKEEVNAN